MNPNFRMLPLAAMALTVSLTAGLSACDNNNDDNTPKLADIQNVVVIYAENRSFDGLYGNFPGANGMPGVNTDAKGSYLPQLDRDGTVLSQLPPIWGGLSNGATVDTAGGATKSTITEAQTSGLPNKPFQFDVSNFNNTGIAVDQTVVSTDMGHRFYNEQMQIGADGKKTSVVAWADSGAAPMGYWNGTTTKLGTLVKNEGVLADNFFQGAFGGSSLNHQYLICACAPEYPNADTDPATPVQAVVDTGDGKGRTGIQGVALAVSASNPASAISGKPVYVSDSYLTPKLSVDPASGKATYNPTTGGSWYGVNTMQPPYQPSSNPPPASDTTNLTTDRSTSHKNTLPPQTNVNIGDKLDAKGVSWAWYSGAWNQAVAATTTAGHDTSSLGAAAVNFQYHHQAFNYYKEADPTTAAGAAYRQKHLKDESDLVSAAAAGTLPAVSFYKPNGPINQHPGYANVKEADDHIADLITKLKASPQWKNMLVIVTYDEFGGQWDHVQVPKGDWLGPGSRIPALLFGPFVKAGTVDHTQYDTASILRFITKRWGLDTLPGLTMRDTALVANGNPKMGDLTAALNAD